jgi:hypothetical protein
MVRMISRRYGTRSCATVRASADASPLSTRYSSAHSSSSSRGGECHAAWNDATNCRKLGLHGGAMPASSATIQAMEVDGSRTIRSLNSRRR